VKKSIYILFLLPLAGCLGDSQFSDNNPKIEWSQVSEIKLFPYCSPTDTCDPEPYFLRDKKLIEEFVKEINEGKFEGSMKIGNLDRISIINTEDKLVLYTNGSVFGLDEDGAFYKLRSENFYLKYWGIK
jgi:hypothetical protein